METTFIVQIKAEDKWKAVYKGPDATKAAASHHIATEQAGNDKVRVLKSNGTKDDGTTHWIAVEMPEKRPEPESGTSGWYRSIVDTVYKIALKNNPNMKRSFIAYVWLPLSSCTVIALVGFSVYATMVAPPKKPKAKQQIVSAMTIEQYVANCKSLSGNEFDQKCKGKLIVFEGTVRKIINSSKLEIDIPVANSSKPQGFDLSLKKEYNWPDSWGQYELLPLKIAGYLENNDFTDHDIKGAVFLQLGSLKAAQYNREFRERLKQLKLAQVNGFKTVAEYEANIAERKACQTDWTKCTSQEQLIEDYRNISSIRSLCKREANKRAKYETDWSWIPFGSYYPNENSVQTGKLTLVDNEVKFQNGFGAFVKTKITCDYDLKADKLLYVNIR